MSFSHLLKLNLPTLSLFDGSSRRFVVKFVKRKVQYCLEKLEKNPQTNGLAYSVLATLTMKKGFITLLLGGYLCWYEGCFEAGRHCHHCLQV
jgi:hypothetical protein